MKSKQRPQSSPITNKQSQSVQTKSFFLSQGRANWMDKSYATFAHEGYVQNVIAHRCINMITSCASYVPFKMSKVDNNGNITQVNTHPALSLLEMPNIFDSRMNFMEKIYSYKLISGNAYILALRGSNGTPFDISVLRPDRVAILTNENGTIIGYRYTDQSGVVKNFDLNTVTGECDILHIKNFHPLSDYYGLSVIEAARFAIDQHNEASEYSKSLLQNSARPSGALIVKPTEFNSSGTLTDEQFSRLKEQMDEHTGSYNAGKPMVLEGGLDWKEMSISPKDMDFVENKHSAARDIALAFGIPPQLLCIPGDNTYSNMSEARLVLWEQTIIPIMQDVVLALSKWLGKLYNDNFILNFDGEEMLTLSSQKNSEWDRISAATFLTPEEKKKMLGLDKILG